MTRFKIPKESDLALVRKYVEYNPITGVFVWKDGPSNRTKVGMPIGNKCGKYLNIRIKGVHYYMHRLAWFLYHGEWPNFYIDHINGNPLDNRIENLRRSSDSENNQNKPQHRSGLLVGTSYHAVNKKWRATAPKNYLNRKADAAKHLGYFNTMQEAAQAVIEFCSKKDAI